MHRKVRILEGIKIFLPSLNKHLGRGTHLPMVATRIRMNPLRMRNQTKEVGRRRRRNQTATLLILEMMTLLTMKTKIFQMRKRTMKNMTQEETYLITIMHEPSLWIPVT